VIVHNHCPRKSSLASLFRAFFAVCMLLAPIPAMGGKGRFSPDALSDPASSYPARGERASDIIKLFWAEGFPSLAVTSQADFLVYLWLSRGSLEPEAVTRLEENAVLRGCCEERLYGLIDTDRAVRTRKAIIRNVQRARPIAIAGMMKALREASIVWTTMEGPPELEWFLKEGALAETKSRSLTMNRLHPMKALAELRGLAERDADAASLPLVLPPTRLTGRADSGATANRPGSPPTGPALVVVIFACIVALGLNVRSARKPASAETDAALTRARAATAVEDVPLAVIQPTVALVETVSTDAVPTGASTAEVDPIMSAIDWDETIETARKRSIRCHEERTATASAKTAILLQEQTQRLLALAERNRAAAFAHYMSSGSYIRSHVGTGQLACV
jgi:hypothetical protein